MNKPTVRKELVEMYFRFRSLIQGLKELPYLEALSPDMEALLARIGEAHLQGKTMAVRKLLLREELGSPATIHKRIHLLRSKGYVEFKGVENDSRVKLVVPTEEAMRYFSEHARILKEAAKAA